MTAQPDQMRREELPMVLGWAKEEGWNPGLDDAETFFATDPNGFFVSRIGSAPVAAISVVNHSPEFAFLGLYLCKPDWRGQGIGKALWDHATKHAGARTIGLDAVPDQQTNYAKAGFVPTQNTQRFSGEIRRAGPLLRQAKPADLPWMEQLDNQVFGYAKPTFLNNWCAETQTRKTFVLDGQTGFATVRKCVSGAKIGPLIAKDAEGAVKLMDSAATGFDGPIIIDLPTDNEPLMAHCQNLGMNSDFTTSRMYRGKAPTPGSPHRSIATLELG